MDFDGGPTRRKVDGVFQQIGDRGAEDERIAADGQGSGMGFVDEIDAGDFGERVCLIDGAGEDVAEIDFRGFFEAGAAFDGGEFEQAVDEALAAGGLGADIAEEAFAGLDGHFLVQQLGRAADGGERAFHFVGECLDVAFDVFAVFQRIAHRVQRAGQGVYLAADADVRFGGAFAAFDGAGVFGDFSDRVKQPEEHRADQEEDAAADEAAGDVDDAAALADERHDIELRLVNR